MATSFEQLLTKAKSSYGYAHKLLAQTLLNESVFESPKIADIFLEIVKSFDREFRFTHLSTTEKETLQAALVHKMNEKLSEVLFRIAPVVDEYVDGQKTYYALISDLPHTDAFASTFGGYSKQAMGLFDMWLQLMYGTSETSDGRIAVEQALNAIDSMQYTMSKKTIQETINKMVEEKWLINDGGMLRLHPRSLAQLRPTLTQEPFSVLSCNVCRNIVSNSPVAVKCQCGVTIHRHCYMAMSGASRGNQLTCDRCKEPLLLPVDENDD